MRLLVLLIVLSALSSCSDPKQINVVLRTADRSEGAAEIVSEVADRTGMKLARRQFEYGGKDGTQLSFTLDDFDTVMQVQSSLEDCNRLDPCFSSTRYMVSIYAKWPWVSDASLGDLGDAIRDSAIAHGGTVVLNPRSSNDVPDWRP